jgi:hypothetical protein
VQAFTALVGFDYTRERGTGWLGANFQGIFTREVDVIGPGDDSDDVPARLSPDDIDNPRRVYNRGMQSWLDLEHYGVKAQLNFDAGPVQIEALGSYRNMRFTQNDGSTAGVVYPGVMFDEQTPLSFSSAFWDQGSESYTGESSTTAGSASTFPITRWTSVATGCPASRRSRSTTRSRSSSSRAPARSTGWFRGRRARSITSRSSTARASCCLPTTA